jgi:hypothetical protein
MMMKACPKRPLLATVGLLLAAGGTVPCAAQVSAPAPAVADPAPENLAIAREIVNLALPPENRRAMLEQMSDTMFSHMRDGILRSLGNSPDAGLQPILDRYLERFRIMNNELSNEGAPAMFEAVARAYARMFSREELVQISAFASTPVGTRYFRQAPTLFSDPDVAEASRAAASRMMTALQPMMEEMQRDIEAYAARREPRRR